MSLAISKYQSGKRKPNLSTQYWAGARLSSDRLRSLILILCVHAQALSWMAFSHWLLPALLRGQGDHRWARQATQSKTVTVLCAAARTPWHCSAPDRLRLSVISVEISCALCCVLMGLQLFGHMRQTWAWCSRMLRFLLLCLRTIISESRQEAGLSGPVSCREIQFAQLSKPIIVSLCGSVQVAFSGQL